MSGRKTGAAETPVPPDPDKYFGGKKTGAAARAAAKAEAGKEKRREENFFVAPDFADVDLNSVSGVKQYIQDLMESARVAIENNDTKATEKAKGYASIVSMAKVTIDLIAVDREEEIEEIKRDLQKIGQKSAAITEENAKYKLEISGLKKALEAASSKVKDYEDRYVRTQIK